MLVVYICSRIDAFDREKFYDLCPSLKKQLISKVMEMLLFSPQAGMLYLQILFFSPQDMVKE